ncbi:hypothetical protein [Actinomadura parmotrematis]|uniref:DNA-directed RNA polymerase specialized sigma24 family protein n=1 Tax=Actinomadura parmotrematis TaxID=2864039 RepID=A0ABS7FYA4_9ACTN|nr:hypothetical protein [Actinomadura parmotrematis]MBW8485418.1 hypothetical protein [Actinomadura parmotrematis]
MTRPVVAAHYCDLVWLAYFVLPGEGPRRVRLATARRIVDGAHGTRFGGDERRRAKVLRKAMRPPRRLRAGLGPWLRALPAGLPDAALTAALAPLAPDERAAYALLRIAGMPRYLVRDQLAGLGVRAPWPAIEAAEALPATPVRLPEPFDPAQLRPVRRRSPIPMAAAGLLTAALVGALVVTESGETLLGGGRAASAVDLRLATAAPGAWRHGAHSLDDWPARGDLAADRAFTTAALDAWGEAAPALRPRQGDRVQLLYAGRVAGAPVAVLRDGDRIARFGGAPASLRVTAAGAGADAPVALGGGRYLLAPWDASAARPGGRPVRVAGGVTAPVVPATPCRRGPLLDLKGTGGARTIGDLGGPRPAVLAYHSPDHRAPAGEPADSARPGVLPAAGRRLWDRLGCLMPQPGRPVVEAMAWDFWTGRLPHGGKGADWVCTRTTFAGGGTATQSSLLTGAGRLATGGCDDRRPVAGTWWRSPAGRWYYLAASGRGLEPAAGGQVRRPKVAKRLLVATAPDPRTRPRQAVLPTVRAR